MGTNITNRFLAAALLLIVSLAAQACAASKLTEATTGASPSGSTASDIASTPSALTDSSVAKPPEPGTPTPVPTPSVVSTTTVSTTQTPTPTSIAGTMPVAPPTATSAATATTTASPTVTTQPPSPPTSTGVPQPLADLSPEQALLSSWMLNVDDIPAAVISDASVVPTDVQSAELVDVDGTTYLHIRASGIPSYETTISQDHIDFLDNRPRQAHDFMGGSTLVSLEDQVSFGEDIGYRSTGCEDVPGSGYGYWPPGPACPTSQDWEARFPVDPVKAAEPVATGLGAIGLWVNGTAIFNWSDGQSWQGERVWWNLAPAAEAYDLDICPGHSAMGTYHHHSNPTCLADQLGYDWYHSPIYGFAADGVPIAGPWVSDNTLARSSWRVRDYADPDSATGCGVAGQRTCLLVDQMDPAAGTVTTDLPGPDIGTAVTSQSGNAFLADTGWFMQDWYYDASLNDASPMALDEHNGHLGTLPGFTEPRYHYHVTQEQRPDGSLVDVFPYYVGPTLWGELHDSALTGGGNGTLDRQPPEDGGDAPPPGNNLQAAAETLGVSVQVLQDALGPPPPDLERAAEILGATVEQLRSLLPAPPRP